MLLQHIDMEPIEKVLLMHVYVYSVIYSIDYYDNHIVAIAYAYC